MKKNMGKAEEGWGFMLIKRGMRRGNVVIGSSEEFVNKSLEMWHECKVLLIQNASISWDVYYNPSCEYLLELNIGSCSGTNRRLIQNISIPRTLTVIHLMNSFPNEIIHSYSPSTNFSYPLYLVPPKSPSKESNLTTAQDIYHMPISH
jgi:hypothetical protein